MVHPTNCSSLLQHLFALEQKDELMKCVSEAGATCVGVAIKQRKEPITFEQFQLNRLGKYRLYSPPFEAVLHNIHTVDVCTSCFWFEIIKI